MVKVTNMFGDEYSGAVGNAGVFAKWKGIQYRRKYVIPANPKTSKQVAVRTSFTNAIAEWHAYNSLQMGAFAYLAAGKGMSGMNMLVRRWQKNYLTTRTVRPSYGMKTIGSALTLVSALALAAAQESPLTLGAGKIVSIDDQAPTASVPGAVKINTGLATLKAFVDLEMGQVRIVTSASNKYWVSYKYGGNQISWEDIGTGTATKHLKYFPVDYKSVVIQDAATKPTDYTTGAVQGMEVDIVNGKVYATNAATEVTDKVDYTNVTFLSDVKLEVQKANSSFVAFRGYTDSKGRIKLGLTAQDENYDTDITKTGYTAISRINQAAAAAAKNESLIMSV